MTLLAKSVCAMASTKSYEPSLSIVMYALQDAGLTQFCACSPSREPGELIVTIQNPTVICAGGKDLCASLSRRYPPAVYLTVREREGNAVCWLGVIDGICTEVHIDSAMNAPLRIVIASDPTVSADEEISRRRDRLCASMWGRHWRTLLRQLLSAPARSIAQDIAQGLAQALRAYADDHSIEMLAALANHLTEERLRRWSDKTLRECPRLATAALEVEYEWGDDGATYPSFQSLKLTSVNGEKCTLPYEIDPMLFEEETALISQVGAITGAYIRDAAHAHALSLSIGECCVAMFVHSGDCQLVMREQIAKAPVPATP